LGEGSWGLSDHEHPEFDVEDGASAFLRFASGATLTLDVSWAIHQREQDRMNVVLHGSDAGAACYPGELYRFGAQPGAYETSTLGHTPLSYPHENRFHNFIGAVQGSEQLCVTPAQALSVQRILDAIYESSRLGREVMLSHGSAS
jgi:predicted dehydrogenase